MRARGSVCGELLLEESVAETVVESREARTSQPGGENGARVLDFGRYGALEAGKESVAVDLGGVVRGWGKKRGRGPSTTGVSVDACIG